MPRGLVASLARPWLRARRDVAASLPFLAIAVPAIIVLTLGAQASSAPVRLAAPEIQAHASGSTATPVDIQSIRPQVDPPTTSFQQGVGGYTGAVDTFIASASPTVANPAAATITVDGSPLQHVLIRFDDIFGNGAGQIPPNATILSASLTVNVTNASANAAAFHRMIQAWSGASTWDSMVGGVQANGVEALATADLTGSSSATGSFSISVAASVAAWSAGGTNLGWVLLPGGTDGWGFESSEAVTLANRPRLSVTYTTDRAPDLPTDESPATGTTGVSTNPTLCVDVSDPDGDALTVTFKGRPTGQPAPQDFTIIALPDTQFYAQSYPATFNAQTQWCVDNRLTRNIAFVTQLGDCTNNGNSIPGEWTNANAAFSLLEDALATGLAHGIPFGIAVGNHDQTPVATARSGADEGTAFGGAGGTFGGTTEYYNRTFGAFRFQGRGYFGGHYDFGVPAQYSDSMDNHFELFSASGMDFIAFHLEWDDVDNPTRQAVLSWMHTLLSTTYSNRRAMISAHYLLNPNGTFSNQGQATFNAVKDLPNVFLMLAGHLDQANRRTDLADDGHPIHTLLSDYQTRPNGGNGWLRIMTFSPASDTFHVQTYSPTLGQFINNHADNTAGTAQNDFALAYDMDSGTPFATIGTVSGVTSGGQACAAWPGRETGQEYEWFAEVSDGTLTTAGPLWTFTASCSTNAECDDAIFCTTDTCSGGSCLHSPIAECCATNAECDDADTCTNDACNLSSHTCENAPIDCNDGRSCTGPDACLGGVCQNPYAPFAGCCATPADCDDGIAATTDTCSAGTCSNVNTSCVTGADCGDGDACTTDSCTAANLRSLVFDGVDDHVTMGAAAGLNASPSFTVEAWINGIGGTTLPTGTGTQGFAANTVVPLVAKGRAEQETPANVNMNYFVGIFDPAGARALAADFEDSATGLNHPVCTTTSLPTTGWHQVAATYSPAGGWSLYVDGVAQTLTTTCTTCTGGNCTTTPGASPEPDSIQHFAIGTALNSTGVLEGRYAGKMDEVRVWNVARSATDIADARDELITSAPNLIAHYGFDDSTATDSTAPAESGTLVGSPVFDSADRPSVGGACVYAPLSCDDGDPCTADSCGAGGCLHIPANDGGACNDGSGCTTDDICTNGVCAGTLSCDDGNSCTGADQCVSGSCQNPYNPIPGCCTMAADCDDGNPGTADSCLAGTCSNANLVCATGADCDDSNGCTTDTCDASNVSGLNFDGTNDYVTMGPAAGTDSLGATTFTVETWFKWTGGGTGVSTGTGGIAAFIPLVAKGAAQAETPANLNANYLLGIAGGRLAGDFEDAASGLNHPVCTAAAQPTITTNVWHHAAATYNGTCWALYLDGVAVPIDTACSSCAGGACTVCPSATPESTSIQHFGLGTTLTSTGTAAGFYQGRLDEVRVWNVARSLAQIQADQFQEVSTAPNLIGRWGLNDNGGASAADSTTPAENGTLTNGPAWSPADKAPLTSGTCSYTPIPGCIPCSTALDCDDANACTTDACVDGACVSTPVVCADDGNVCNGPEACNPGTGMCDSGPAAANGTSCADGDLCNGAETCQAGSCVAGAPLACSDANPCTNDSCNPATGCVYTNNTAPCTEDGNPCTDDVCSGGSCTHPNDDGNTCADPNACTGDACVSGACLSWYAPTPACCNSSADCNDGAAATTDSCSGAPGGNCANVVSSTCTTNANCNDSNGCTTDVCSTSNVSALNFDGTNDYVTMGPAAGTAALGATTFTLETWFKWTGGGTAVSTGGGGIAAFIPLVAKGAAQAETPANFNANYLLGIAGGRLAGDFEDAATGLNHPVCTAAAQPTITTNVWHHAAATYNGTCWALYLDGVAVPIDTACSTCAGGACTVCPSATPESTSIQHFGLGTTLSTTGAATGFYQGRMDEVRVWNVARSQAQIQADQFQEVSTAPNLIGRWGLNDNGGTSAADSTTPAENGTLTNGPAWSPADKAPAPPGTCSNTPVPDCESCTASYQCNDSNSCTTDSCNTTNDAAVSLPSPGAAANHVDLALGMGSNFNPDYVNSFGSGSFTIEGWVYTDGGAAALTGIFRGGQQGAFPQVAVQLTGTGNLQVAGSVESNTAGTQVDVTHGTALTANTWAHFAFVVDRTSGSQQLRLHLNGGTPATAVANVLGTNPVSFTSQSMIGAGRLDTGAVGLPFDGRLDEIRIWSYARTQAETAADMGREIASAAGLVHRWSFNEGSLTTAADSAGGITGTLTGATTWSATALPFAGTDSCTHTTLANGTVCSDGNACTQTDSCQSGVCAGSGAVTCTASDQCHDAGTCDPGTGLCSNPVKPEGSACTDGDACTQTDSCQSGVCTGSSAVTCTASDQCHNAGTCNPATGICSDPAKPDGFACTDGNACTQKDLCQSGVCSGTNPVTCPAPDQCHDPGTCNPATGICSNPEKPIGSACTDGNACTTTDTCRNGACLAGPPANCNDDNVCTDDSCNPAVGCGHSNNTASCDDGDLCNGTGVCQDGSCIGTPPPNCDDGNPCTTDSCDPVLGCQHANNTAPCDDGSACTVGDVCGDGACVPGTPVVCTASDQCHDAGICDTATGLCSDPPKPDGFACTDGNACTQKDLCQSGVCSGTNPVTCPAPDQCHDAGTCNPATGICSNPLKPDGSACTDGNACTTTDACRNGACLAGPPANCNDDNVCTDDSCDPAVGCGHSNNTASCDDGDLCNGTGVCQAGSCAGTPPPDCDDGNPCTTDSCDPVLGCQHVNNTAPCDDGSACTVGDVCGNGACVPGTPVVCTASDQCHDAGICDTLTGVCSNPAKPNGATCSDGNACTQTDTCQSGACIGSNTVTCTASDQCHDAGTCDTATGLCSNPARPDGATCSDGNACTQTDTCQSGACTGSNTVTCTATDQCHDAGTCDTATGICSNPAKPNGATCSDGNACTQTDTCQTGVCLGSNTVTCTATDQCHDAGTCDTATGLCSNPAKPNGTTCSDGNACTQTDTCQAGACTSGSAVVCVASDQCHMPGTCDPGSGVCSNPARPDGSACEDGNACSAGDTCVGGACTPGATPPEVCNNIDDNCNGQVDEGNPGGGVACSTGQPGVCSAGITQCSGGSIVCVGTTLPATSNVVAQINTSMKYIAYGSTTAAEDAVLVQIDSPMRYKANAIDPGIGLAWIGETYDDTGWASGTYGVGYDTAAPPNALSLIKSSVPAGVFSVFTRATFTLADVSTVKSLFYGADYDDGYVAYLNGVEVARSSTMPAGNPAWNTDAALHESSNAATPNYGTLIDLTGSIPLLHNGTNVLAVGVWNSAAATSTDLVVVPKLSIGLDWTARTFDDSAWATGTYGVGYDTGAAPNALSLIKTSVPAGTLSVFTRAHFNIPDAAALAAIQRVTLGVDYDDGTVAWINGVEVLGSAQMPFGPLTPTTPATAHESSNGAVPNYAPIRDITARALPALVVGDNVLAIGVWNDLSTSTDLVLVPRLSLGEAERCDGLDNDCNGVADDGFADGDQDGTADCVDTDDDGDGAADGQDCRPLDALFSAAPPAEVLDLLFSRAPDRSFIMTWAGQGEGLRYDVAGGLLSRLVSDHSALNATCVPGGNDLVEARFVDARQAPPRGDAYYYIVRSQSSFCGSGTYGYASSGSEYLPASACP